jgi:hypothetical protein
MAELEDDGGNNFFDLNDPPLEHGNNIYEQSCFVCSQQHNAFEVPFSVRAFLFGQE